MGEPYICYDCQSVTNGDCGKHGPRRIDVPPTIYPAFTPPAPQVAPVEPEVQWPDVREVIRRIGIGEPDRIHSEKDGGFGLYYYGKDLIEGGAHRFYAWVTVTPEVTFLFHDRQTNITRSEEMGSPDVEGLADVGQQIKQFLAAPPQPDPAPTEVDPLVGMCDKHPKARMEVDGDFCPECALEKAAPKVDPAKGGSDETRYTLSCGACGALLDITEAVRRAAPSLSEGSPPRTEPRACTCHQSEAPVPCQHKYAASECLAAARAERIEAAARERDALQAENLKLREALAKIEAFERDNPNLSAEDAANDAIFIARAALTPAPAAEPGNRELELERVDPCHCGESPGPHVHHRTVGVKQ